MIAVFEQRVVRRADPQRALTRALATMLGGSVVAAETRPWASATFTGTRHRITILVDGEARALAAAAVAGLPETVFEIPNHLVAECTVADRTDHGSHLLVTIEALTLEAD